jgi:hypothetical protein
MFGDPSVVSKSSSAGEVSSTSQVEYVVQRLSHISIPRT